MHDLLRPFIIAFGRVITSYTCRDTHRSHHDQYPVMTTETPTTSSSSTSTSTEASSNYTGSIPSAGACEVLYYSTTMKMSCPNIYSAAILFGFLIKQSHLDTPTHVPPRAMREAMQNPGLAAEDFLAFTQYQMPTVMESDGSLPSLFNVADNQFSRSMMHSDDYIRAISECAPNTFNYAHAYAPGVLTGVWDGQYMVSLSVYKLITISNLGLQDSPYPVPDLDNFRNKPSEFPNFISRRPMQFRLREYMDSYPDGNLPTPSRGGRRVRRGTSRPTSSDVSNGSRMIGL